MSTIRRSTRAAISGGALALSLALTLSACGGNAAPTGTIPATEPPASAPAAADTEHNDADVRFAQGMIPHHRQAVEMAEIAVDRAENPEVKALAERIQAAQDPEINTLSGLLEAWGAEVPADGDMAGMDHSNMPGMSDMSGMMTTAQMDELRNATGAAFDTAFLQMMIAHHEGAVSDAQRELAEGVNPQAKDLATEIVTAQTAEIEQMRQLLQGA
jgi:uncharacterized protein (DUF305 family)